MIIEIPEKLLNQDFVIKFLKRLEFEQIIEKVEFDEKILDFAEELKKDWWSKNKDRFLNGEKNSY